MAADDLDPPPCSICVRPMRIGDLERLVQINLDQWTETFNTNFYLSTCMLRGPAEQVRDSFYDMSRAQSGDLDSRSAT